MDDDQFDEELKELDGKFDIVTDASPRNTPILELWSEFFHHITPAELYEQFERAGGEDNTVKVRICLVGGNAFIEAYHNSDWHSNDWDNIIVFQISEDGQTKLERTFFRSGDQDKSLAKRYLRAGYDLFEEIGVADKPMKVNAVEVGGYAWIQYGFTPATPEEWEKLQEQLRMRFNYDEGTLTFRGKTYDVSLERDIIQRIIDSDFSQMSEVIEHFMELNRPLEGKITVGKALLINTRWNGILTDIERFNCYTAGAAEQLQKVG